MEKWMQSNGGNPYARKPVAHRVRNRVRRMNRSAYSKTIAAHHGMPIQMFKDSDRDGVMNALDCQPHNKRKQDIRRPQNVGRGGISNMYARKEQHRFTRDYMKQLNEIQRQEYQRLLELQRIQTPVSSNRSRSSNTPVIYADGKWVSMDSAAGKAQIAKDVAKYDVAINPPIGSTNPGYQTGTVTYSGSTPSSSSSGGSSRSSSSGGSRGGTYSSGQTYTGNIMSPSHKDYSPTISNKPTVKTYYNTAKKSISKFFSRFRK